MTSVKEIKDRIKDNKNIFGEVLGEHMGVILFKVYVEDTAFLIAKIEELERGRDPERRGGE